MFSIVLPIYNIKEEYLQECMQSLLLQTFKDYEIILVNDGSNNGCDKWCDEFAKQYPDVVSVIHKKNEGVSEARNTGIDYARGEYIVFVDPDDWVELDMCETINEVLKNEIVDIMNLSYITEFRNASITHEESDKAIKLTSNQKRELLLKLIDTTNKLDYEFYNAEIFGSVDKLKVFDLVYDIIIISIQEVAFYDGKTRSTVANGYFRFRFYDSEKSSSETNKRHSKF